MNLSREYTSAKRGVKHTYRYKISTDTNGNIKESKVKLKGIGGQYPTYSGTGYTEISPKDIPTEVTAEFINRLEGVAREFRGHE